MQLHWATVYSPGRALAHQLAKPPMHPHGQQVLETRLQDPLSDCLAKHDISCHNSAFTAGFRQTWQNGLLHWQRAAMLSFDAIICPVLVIRASCCESMLFLQDMIAALGRHQEDGSPAGCKTLNEVPPETHPAVRKNTHAVAVDSASD